MPAVGRARRLAVPCVVIWLLVTSCAPQLAVRSDTDPSADFSRYHTWNFFDQLGVEGGNNSAIYGELFREAISREMGARGYRLSDHPDLLVNVSMRGDDKVKMRSYAAPYMSGYYYGQPHYGASGVGIGAGVSTRASMVTEASVFIDLVDAGRHKMVWQGVAATEVTDEVAARLEDSVHSAVNAIFDQYPYRAQP